MTRSDTTDNALEETVKYLAQWIRQHSERG